MSNYKNDIDISLKMSNDFFLKMLNRLQKYVWIKTVMIHSFDYKLFT